MVTKQKRALFIHFNLNQIIGKQFQKTYKNKIMNLVAVLISAFNKLFSFSGTSFLVLLIEIVT